MDICRAFWLFTLVLHYIAGISCTMYLTDHLIIDKVLDIVEK